MTSRKMFTSPSMSMGWTRLDARNRHPGAGGAGILPIAGAGALGAEGTALRGGGGGCDVVELAPIEGADVWDFTAAQLTYALIGIAQGG